MGEVIDYDVCKNCGGFCCRNMFRVLEPDEITSDILEYFVAVSKYKKTLDDGRVVFVIESKCKHVTQTGCDLGDNKPKMCKEFPNGENEVWMLFCPLMKKLNSKGEL